MFYDREEAQNRGVPILIDLYNLQLNIEDVTRSNDEFEKLFTFLYKHWQLSIFPPVSFNPSNSKEVRDLFIADEKRTLLQEWRRSDDIKEFLTDISRIIQIYTNFVCEDLYYRDDLLWIEQMKKKLSSHVGSRLFPLPNKLPEGGISLSGHSPLFSKKLKPSKAPLWEPYLVTDHSLYGMYLAAPMLFLMEALVAVLTEEKKVSRCPMCCQHFIKQGQGNRKYCSRCSEEAEKKRKAKNNDDQKPDYKELARQLAKLPIGNEMTAGEIAKNIDFQKLYQNRKKPRPPKESKSIANFLKTDELKAELKKLRIIYRVAYRDKKQNYYIFERIQ